METTRQTIREKALQIALGYEGREEVPRGSNAGKFVEDCLRLVGLGKGNAWCQAFVYRCYHEAGSTQVVKTAGVLACWNNVHPQLRVPRKAATIANILPGSQFIYDLGHGLGHTGLVIALHPNGTFDTIEGNTDPAGSRNGYGVFRRQRSLKDAALVGFVVYG